MGTLGFEIWNLSLSLFALLMSDQHIWEVSSNSHVTHSALNLDYKEMVASVKRVAGAVPPACSVFLLELSYVGTLRFSNLAAGTTLVTAWPFSDTSSKEDCVVCHAEPSLEAWLYSTVQQSHWGPDPFVLYGSFIYLFTYLILLWKSGNLIHFQHELQPMVACFFPHLERQRR